MQTIKLTIKDWLDNKFPPPSSRPTAQTVRNMIDRGELMAEQIGRVWYIITEPTTGNEEVDQILREIS